MTQRLCDSYHSAIASSTIAILADVINTNPELATNEDIQAFCSMALQDDFFIYSNTDTNNPEVILLFLCVQCTNVSLQTLVLPQPDFGVSVFWI